MRMPQQKDYTPTEHLHRAKAAVRALGRHLEALGILPETYDPTEPNSQAHRTLVVAIGEKSKQFDALLRKAVSNGE